MTQRRLSKPAILGGPPAVTEDHAKALRWPVLTHEDHDAVIKILQNGNISTHPVIRELESDYRTLTSMPYALAHCNGTSALLAAFFSIGLQPGDEVLVPSATFWASVLPMLWLGAIPVFCESEPDRLGLDPNDLAHRLTPRTRAMVITHLWGLPSRMTELIAFAEKHHLRIVEDASHAHGASWRGRPCGSLGDVAVFSLQGDKLAPGGEGGMLLCREEPLFQRAICLGDITRILELPGPEKRFAATSFGIKTRIAPLSAAVARVQLQHLEERNLKRNENLEYLSRTLETMGFHTFMPPPHIHRTYFEFIVRYKPETPTLPIEQLIHALRAEGSRVSIPRYPLLHQQPFFTEGHFRTIARLPESITPPDYKANALPRTEVEGQFLLQLPSFPNADRRILDQYIEAFDKVLSHASSICTA